VTAETLRSWIAGLACLDRRVEDAERVTQLELLERLKSAAAAAQAVVTVDFAASQRAEQLAAGVPAGRAGAGVGAQVGLARRDSPFRGGRYLGLAQALTAELPATLAALRVGDVSEWRATLVARETACLDPADRRVADAELGPAWPGWGTGRCRPRRGRWPTGWTRGRSWTDPGRGLGSDGDAAAGAGHHVQVGRVPAGRPGRRRAHGAVHRGRPARRRRRRAFPRPDHGRHPGRAGHRTGHRAARSRSRWLWSCPNRPCSGVGTSPAELAGAGPVPAAVARALVTDPDPTVWLRRVYTRPTDGSLVAMDSTRRRFPTGLRRLIRTRDRTCRTPWCGAPIRHTDHVIPVADGGRRPRERAGLCEACNYTKQAPGWTSTPGTPTGRGRRPGRDHHPHRTQLHQPPTTPASPPTTRRHRSLIEEHLRRLIHAA
jgi:hypothetical protein